MHRIAVRAPLRLSLGTWNKAPTSYVGHGNGGYVVEYVPEPSGLALALIAPVGHRLITVCVPG